MERCEEFFGGFEIHDFGIFVGKKILASIFGYFVRMAIRSGKVYCDSMISKQT